MNVTQMRQSWLAYMIIALILDNPFRRFTMNAEDVLARMGVRKGLDVMEIGCGPGFFTLPAGKIIEDGNIYALDISPYMAKRIKRKVEKQGLENVTTITSSASNTGLEDETIDLIICIDVMSEIADGNRVFQEMYRILKSEGTLSIFEPHAGLEPGVWKPERSIEELTASGLFSLRERDDKILKFNKVIAHTSH